MCRLTKTQYNECGHTVPIWNDVCADPDIMGLPGYRLCPRFREDFQRRRPHDRRKCPQCTRAGCYVSSRVAEAEHPLFTRTWRKLYGEENEPWGPPGMSSSCAGGTRGLGCFCGGAPPPLLLLLPAAPSGAGGMETREVADDDTGAGWYKGRWEPKASADGGGKQRDDPDDSEDGDGGDGGDGDNGEDEEEKQIRALRSRLAEYEAQLRRFQETDVREFRERTEAERRERGRVNILQGGHDD